MLLYSGGLDTSCMVRFIPEKYGIDVVTVTVDVGQKKDLKEVRDKALRMGAREAFVIDAKKEFADDYIAKAIKANALYEGAYPLSSALSRPLIAKLAVKIAKQVNAGAIAHGCSGKGNDQVRFEVAISSLAPDLRIIAPVREFGLTRDEELKFAQEHGIPLPKDAEYSIDENLWGRSIECGVLEDPSVDPPKDLLGFTLSPEEAPNKAERLSLEFEKGIPVALNGSESDLFELIMSLNEIAGKHGVGHIDHIEDRVVGLKSREVYECPAATVILKAHKDLEKLVCTKHENAFKPIVDQRWTELVYDGLWVDPLRNDLEKFIDEVNEKVEGKVRMKLYKGAAMVVGRESPNALYDLKLSSYSGNGIFDQGASSGFIKLWGLHSKVASMTQNEV